MLDFGMTIGGRQIAGQDNLAAMNPATGEVVGNVTNATIDDLDNAVSTTKAASGKGSILPVGSHLVRQGRPIAITRQVPLILRVHAQSRPFVAGAKTRR